MLAVITLGLAFYVVGETLAFNVGGTGDLVRLQVCSRYLGSLAPGYAAAPKGFRQYCVLVAAVGVLFIGVGVLPASQTWGLVTAGVGLAGFVVASVRVLRGEWRSWRVVGAK